MGFTPLSKFQWSSRVHVLSEGSILKDFIIFSYEEESRGGGRIWAFNHEEKDNRKGIEVGRRSTKKLV